METEILGADPSAIRLRTRADGRLLFSAADEVDCLVSIRRCFPWSEPLAWLSLRSDVGGNEVVLIEDADRLGPESRDALLRALAEAAFVFEILELISVTEEFELRQWRVRLVNGERIFQTKLLSWPRELASGGLLIQDVAGDLYLVADPENLPASSKEKLWAFLDD